MGHVIVSLFLFAAVMLCTVVVFGAWLVVVIFRFLVRLFTGPSYRQTRGQTQLNCGNERCLAHNPPSANYCRRCGRQLRPVQQRMSMGLAAMS